MRCVIVQALDSSFSWLRLEKIGRGNQNDGVESVSRHI
jgi:hypothetical protein